MPIRPDGTRFRHNPGPTLRVEATYSGHEVDVGQITASTPFDSGRPAGARQHVQGDRRAQAVRFNSSAADGRGRGSPHITTRVTPVGDEPGQAGLTGSSRVRPAPGTTARHTFSGEHPRRPTSLGIAITSTSQTVPGWRRPARRYTIRPTHHSRARRRHPRSFINKDRRSGPGAGQHHLAGRSRNPHAVLTVGASATEIVALAVDKALWSPLHALRGRRAPRSEARRPPTTAAPATVPVSLPRPLPSGGRAPSVPRPCPCPPPGRARPAAGGAPVRAPPADSPLPRPRPPPPARPRPRRTAASPVPSPTTVPPPRPRPRPSPRRTGTPPSRLRPPAPQPAPALAPARCMDAGARHRTDSPRPVPAPSRRSPVPPAARRRPPHGEEATPQAQHRPGAGRWGASQRRGAPAW